MINIVVAIFNKIIYMSIIGTIIGIIITVLVKVFDKKLSAKYKCFIWMIAFMFFIVPFTKIPIEMDSTILTMANKVESSMIKEVDPLEGGEKQNTKMKIENKIVDSILPIFWGGVTSTFLVTLLIGNFKLYQQLKETKKCKDVRIKRILQKCKKDLKIKKKIRIRIQSLEQSPCIYGFFKPQIVLPNHLLIEDETTIENVFRHELSHYKRKDMLANYLLLFSTAIHWFNPFIYYFFKKVRQEIELATDELALKCMNQQERKEYGMTLINLLQEYKNETTMSKMLCITDDEKNMERRIRRIKVANKGTYRKIISTLVLVMVTFAILPFVIEAKSTRNDLNTKESQTLEENDVQNANEEDIENSNMETRIDSENREMNQTIEDLIQYKNKLSQEAETRHRKLEE